MEGMKRTKAEDEITIIIGGVVLTNLVGPKARLATIITLIVLLAFLLVRR
jgi:hypothetical protein